MINGKKILAVSLARGGSKSVYKKNIRLLAGRPLIFYTISEAKKSQYIDEYIVSTDDNEIAEISQSLGASIPFLRPPELSLDVTSSADSLMHALLEMEKINSCTYDYVVELMVTNPLKKVSHIDKAIEMLHDLKADSVIAMTQVFDHHPSRIKMLDERGRIVNFYPEVPESRRQDLRPEAFVRCGAIYAMERNYFISSKCRYGSTNSYGLVIPHNLSVNIDDELDFKLAEALFLEK